MASERPALSAVRLEKRYRRETAALAGLDLEVPRGAIVALLGPNGAGKSTLIKHWVGFERPSRGHVEVDGIDPWRHRGAALSRVAYVAQHPGLYRELTVREHFTLASTLRDGFNEASATQRVRDLGIRPEAAVDTLSGGERAQVAIAIALATRAQILLLDEPLAGLDPLARRELLLVLVQTARSARTTIVLASHLVTDVEVACDHLVLLGHGAKLLDGRIDAILQAHSVGSTRPSVPTAIGRFSGPGGEELELRGGTPGAGERHPSLEELALGYLAASRIQPVAA